MRIKMMLVTVLAAGLTAGAAAAQDQPARMSLGSVQLSRSVLANDQPLAAGSYEIRLTGRQADPVVGETPHTEQWIEFLRNGNVVGREVAVVITAADLARMVNRPLPIRDGARVDLLRGGKYLRVWVAKDGTNYVVYLRTGQGH